MSRCTMAALVVAMLAAAWPHDVRADTKTVCTITVNSPDEGDAFRAALPPDRFRFVELVEPGRPDWLASACRKGVRCDVLVVSGHYDGGNEFFSDRLDRDESLPVDELERVSCSHSCPGLFAQLREIYLFGCNTLNAEPLKSASAEIERSLVRAGHPKAGAARLSRALGARHGESSLDRMRQVFPKVPVLYGFSSVAPVGPTAGALLRRYFQAGGAAEVGSGRASPRLLEGFRAHAMVTTRGIVDGDPEASHREDVCRFADERLSASQKLDFVHQLLRRDVAEARLFLDRIEKQVASVSDAERRVPPVAGVLDDIARDTEARARYLAFARDADQPAVRARMLAVAHDLGWLSPDEERAELTTMIGERLEWGPADATDVELVCSLNDDRLLDAGLARLEREGRPADSVANAAVLACLGSAEARARTLQALTGPGLDDVRIAQVYLRHRPIDDANELRAVVAGVARMRDVEAQILALDALAAHRLSDPRSLADLTALFASTESARVQGAIAGVLVRADDDALDRETLLRSLREHRLPSGAGETMVDVLIRRLQAR